jgi:hypothetical protein
MLTIRETKGWKREGVYGNSVLFYKSTAALKSVWKIHSPFEK